MESHPYEKTPGGGGTSAAGANQPGDTNGSHPLQAPFVLPGHPPSVDHGSDICTYVNAKGGRCRMSIVHPDARLCPDHLDKQRRAEQRHTHSVANTLFENMHNFSSPECVNVFLGNLLREFALKRIDRKDAMAMTYISQLLLNSHAAIDRFYDNEENIGSSIAVDLLRKKRELEISLEASNSATEPASPLATPNPPQVRAVPQTAELPEDDNSEEDDPEEM